jgi:O-antigen/teichoic acid export membrane protein
MRIQASIKNSLSGILMQGVTILIGLVSQSIFIKYLGIEYAGVSSVLSNIISMLSIAELGVGSAIVFSLYEPIAKNNVEKIKSLMELYRKTYEIIGIVIAVIGIGLIPFLKYFFKDITVDINLILVFSLYLGDTVSSYFFTYKRSLLYADQKDYINKLIDFLFLIIMNIAQIACIILTKNYYYYLIIRVLVHLVSYIFIVFVVNKRYPYILEKNIKKLSTEEKAPIITNIKGLIFHKIGGFLVLSTDNIIVSSLINVATAGIFNNYKLISLSLQRINGIVMTATTASFGNLIASEPERSFDIFKKIYYINFVIAAIFTTCYMCAVQPFMKFFAGPENIFSISVVFVLSIDLFTNIMRGSAKVGRNAAGIYYNDRYVPLWESAVNLIVSIVLVKMIGVAGVVLGTIISLSVSVFISTPYLTYKYIYHQPLHKYYVTYLWYSGITILSSFIAFKLSTYITIENYFVHFLASGFLGCIVSVICILIFTCHSNEFKYASSLIIKLMSARKNKQKQKENI